MLRSSAEIASRLQGQARRAARDLAAYQASQQDTDRFGTYRLAPGEPIDSDELLAYLHRARREHPDQQLTITVTARAAAATPHSADGAQRKEQHP